MDAAPDEFIANELASSPGVLAVLYSIDSGYLVVLDGSEGTPELPANAAAVTSCLLREEVEAVRAALIDESVRSGHAIGIGYQYRSDTYSLATDGNPIAVERAVALAAPRWVRGVDYSIDEGAPRPA